jgi:hypothetical protein
MRPGQDRFLQFFQKAVGHLISFPLDRAFCLAAGPEMAIPGPKGQGYGLI